MTFVGSIMIFGKRFDLDSPANMLKKMGAQGNKLEHPLLMITFQDATAFAFDIEVTRALLDTISLGWIMDFLPEGKYILT